jgi:hypothetical protein
MYLGPDLKGIVRKNQIFTYHPDRVIEEACGVSPLARHLFVEMENIVEVKKELRREGSFYNLTYLKLQKTEGGRHGRL